MTISEKRLMAVLVILVISYISAKVFLRTVAHQQATARVQREAFIGAVLRGNVRQVAKCLRQGADPNLRIPDDTDYHDYIGRHILNVAISNDKPEAAFTLIRAGAKASSNDIAGLLSMATYNGNIKLVRDIISSGPGGSLPSQMLTGALITATEEGRTSFVAELLAQGADVHVHDSHSTLLLFSAVCGPNANPKIADLLLQRGIDTDLRDPTQHLTPLLQIVDNPHSQRQTDMVELLLKSHCNTELKNDSGDTALRIAENWHNTTIIQLLKKAGAKKMSVFPPIHRRTVEYAVTDLGLGQANTLNDRGEVVGVAGSKRTENDEIQGKAFIWQSGKLQYLDKRNVIASNAASINNRGEVIGISYDHPTSDKTKYRCHIFLWKNGSMRDLYPPTINDTMNGISLNDLGTRNTIVDAIADVYHHKIWKHLPKEVFIYKNLRWDGVLHTAINNRGTITFYLQASGEECAAISKHGGIIHQLPGPPGNWETTEGHKYYQIPNDYAYGINDHDDVVGNCDNGKGDAILWSRGKAITLPHIKENTSQHFAMRANAINNVGDIIGIVTPYLYGGQVEMHAVLWHHGKAYDLNALIPANSGWVLENACAINTKGQIVGSGMYRDQMHAFLLTPINAQTKRPCAPAGRTTNRFNPL